MESATNLARKTQVLERELERQRAALERLRELAEAHRHGLEPVALDAARRMN
jgi:hypothetical protein